MTNEAKEKIPGKVKEILERMNIDLNKFEAEQTKLSRQIKLKDSIDFSKLGMTAGVDAISVGREIIAGIVVLDSNFNVVEEKFAAEKAEFPYVSGFLAYRELPAILKCHQKLETDVDLFLVGGNGILHPRRFGLASHFGLSVQKPAIGIAKSLMTGKVKNGKVYADSEILGEEMITKEGSRPIYVSPGHLISLETAAKITKKLIRLPHKLPEPLDAAHRYVDKIRKELH